MGSSPAISGRLAASARTRLIAGDGIGNQAGAEFLKEGDFAADHIDYGVQFPRSYFNERNNRLLLFKFREPPRFGKSF